MEIVKSLQNQKILKFVLITILGSILLTISAKIKIPFYPVPMTMQTFVVLFMGVAFGWKIGVATISLYLFEGIIGLPVFAGTPEKGVGLVYFTGPTMGYLIGFLIATFLAGYLKPINNLFTKILSSIIFSYLLFIFLIFLVIEALGFGPENLPKLFDASLYSLCLFTTIILAFKTNAFVNALILLISVLPIYILGIFWLGAVIGWDKPLFTLGAAPFLLAESFKIFLLAILYSNLKKLRKFI
jgi:biotin transport system substrate-specific component